MSEFEWEPTMHLRWVRNNHPHGGYDTVLEQLWRKGTAEEWRPVPDE